MRLGFCERAFRARTPGASYCVVRVRIRLTLLYTYIILSYFAEALFRYKTRALDTLVIASNDTGVVP